MSNLNKIFLMGRLTRDPELRYTPQGIPVSDIGLAVNREFTANGERKKETLFIDVTVWRKQAELCSQYLQKGSPLFVEGRLSMDTWDGQDGQKRTRYRVVCDNFQFIGGGSGSGGGGRKGGNGGESLGGGPDVGADFGSGAEETNYGQNYRQGGAPPAQNEPAGGPPDVSEEDIPF